MGASARHRGMTSTKEVVIFFVFFSFFPKSSLLSVTIGCIIQSAWVYIGGFSYELTEGDLICVMSQWGEIQDINLVREKETNKSMGFAFVKYEDQRSTILAVDNFNGIELLGRVLRCDHVDKYKLPKHIREREEERLEANIHDKVDIGPGHAYKHQELASAFDINTGVDLWKANSHSNNIGLSGAAQEVEKSKSQKRNRPEKSDKKEKKHKKKSNKSTRDGNFSVIQLDASSRSGVSTTSIQELTTRPQLDYRNPQSGGHCSFIGLNLHALDSCCCAFNIQQR
jgi:RNA-binding motif X-linked protein 2